MLVQRQNEPGANQRQVGEVISEELKNMGASIPESLYEEDL